MERDYKIRECLTAILIGVCSMNLCMNPRGKIIYRTAGGGKLKAIYGQ